MLFGLVIQKVADIFTKCHAQKLLNLKDDEETIKPIDKAYIKKRRDVLYTINRKGVQPKEDTIKKYNIKYDKTTKTYI